MSLDKMKITAYTTGEYSDEAAAPINPMWVLVNPKSYVVKHEVHYNDVGGQGGAGLSPAFNRIVENQVSFALVFDGTGVVPRPRPNAPPPDVRDQVEAFRQLVVGYNGRIHSPNFLAIAWGTLLFRGRLQKLDIEYTLFKPDGAPLRATTTVTCRRFTDPKELAKEANRGSPDVAHVRTVRAGDTLPNMCQEVYGASAYYVQVARANGLTGFRDLEVGSELLFPPLVRTG